MRMACGKRQHGARDAEIIVLPWKTFIDPSALTQFDLKFGQLLISEPTCGFIDNADLIGVKRGAARQSR
jgi:hypothetical protein